MPVEVRADAGAEREEGASCFGTTRARSASKTSSTIGITNQSLPYLKKKKFMTSDPSHRQSQKSVQEPKALSANAAMKPCLDDIAADLQISPKHEQR